MRTKAYAILSVLAAFFVFCPCAYGLEKEGGSDAAPVSIAQAKKKGADKKSEEKYQQVLEVPPPAPQLVPLAPPKPAQPAAAPESGDREIKAFMSGGAQAAAPSSVTAEAGGKAKEAREGLGAFVLLGAEYDSNILDFSQSEMVAFSRGNMTPELFLNGTKAYEIKGYADFAATPDLRLGYKKSRTSAELGYAGRFYIQNSFANRHLLKLKLEQGVSEKLSFSLGGFYAPEHYYRQLRTPEPYLNPYADQRWFTAKLTSYAVPVLVDYAISERLGVGGGYLLAGRTFNKSFAYRNDAFQGGVFTGRFSHRDILRVGLDYTFGFASAAVDDPVTAYAESDLSRLSQRIHLTAHADITDNVFAGAGFSWLWDHYTTRVEQDLAFYDRSDIVIKPDIYAGYHFGGGFGVLAGYRFVQGATNLTGGISTNGAGDYQRYHVFISLYFGDKGGIAGRSGPPDSLAID